jgi:hypothetical protein
MALATVFDTDRFSIDATPSSFVAVPLSTLAEIVDDIARSSRNRILLYSAFKENWGENRAAEVKIADARANLVNPVAHFLVDLSVLVVHLCFNLRFNGVS